MHLSVLKFSYSLQKNETKRERERENNKETAAKLRVWGIHIWRSVHSLQRCTQPATRIEQSEYEVRRKRSCSPCACMRFLLAWERWSLWTLSFPSDFRRDQVLELWARGKPSSGYILGDIFISCCLDTRESSPCNFHALRNILWILAQLVEGMFVSLSLSERYSTWHFDSS